MRVGNRDESYTYFDVCQLRLNCKTHVLMPPNFAWPKRSAGFQVLPPILLEFQIIRYRFADLIFLAYQSAFLNAKVFVVPTLYLQFFKGPFR